MDAIVAGAAAVVAGAPKGFAGVGKLQHRPHERLLFLQSLVTFVQQDLQDDYPASLELPLWSFISPQHKISLVADLVRGLILIDTPLPPETMLHYLAYLALFDKVGTNVEVEVDELRGFDPSPPTATHWHEEITSKAEEMRQSCAESMREDAQSRRKVLKFKKKANRGGHSIDQLAESQMEAASSAFVSNADSILTKTGPAVVANADSQEAYFRRTFVAFVEERKRHFVEDGRCQNVFHLQLGGKVPHWSRSDGVVWADLYAHVVVGFLNISNKEEQMMRGRVDPQTWARTALLLRTARQHESHFQASWKPCRGLYSLATLLLACFDNGNGDWITNSDVDLWGAGGTAQCDFKADKAWAQQQQGLGAHACNAKQRVANEWCVLFHQVMCRRGLDYHSYGDKIKALDEVFNTESAAVYPDLPAPGVGGARETGIGTGGTGAEGAGAEAVSPQEVVAAAGAAVGQEQNCRPQWFAELYAMMDLGLVLNPLWGGDDFLLLDTAPGAWAETHRREWKEGRCDNTQCTAEKSVPNNSKCSTCRVARYCCKSCQVADWKSHKKDCKLWAAELSAGPA